MKNCDGNLNEELAPVDVCEAGAVKENISGTKKTLKKNIFKKITLEENISGTKNFFKKNIKHFF